MFWDNKEPEAGLHVYGYVEIAMRIYLEAASFAWVIRTLHGWGPGMNHISMQLQR